MVCLTLVQILIVATTLETDHFQFKSMILMFVSWLTVVSHSRNGPNAQCNPYKLLTLNTAKIYT